jgi:DNA-binding Lrp family transcriptional regulator
MLNEKDLLFIAHLRKNAQESLTQISRQTNIPVSTLFDRLQVHNNSIIKKHTTLIDFEKIGYKCKIKTAISVNKLEREKMQSYLKNHDNVNSLFRINNGFDFLIEAIFVNIKDAEEFTSSLEDNFKIKELKTYQIIDDIKLEGFFGEPDKIKTEKKN